MGTAQVVALRGRRPNVVPAMILAVAYGIAIDASLVNAIINGAQMIDTLYDSTPTRSWWVAHAIFGMTLGTLGALLLRRERNSVVRHSPARTVFALIGSNG
jgi:hypothetical protein